MNFLKRHNISRLTLVSMAVSILVYSFMLGWIKSTVIVALIFIHEFGHLVTARHFNVEVSPPVFIPFVGALISMKQHPATPWAEAIIGAGGPFFGLGGSALFHVAGMVFGLPVLVECATISYMINLFNLLPIGQLDGGHIVMAIDYRLKYVGFVAGIAYMIFFKSWIMVLILALSTREVINFLTDQRSFWINHQVPSIQRNQMAFYYGFLIVGLVSGFASTFIFHR
jgi:membrane-associated protease RseP (regulator of RpoE activity)